MGVKSLTDVEDFEVDLTCQLLASMETMCAAKPLEKARIRKAVEAKRPLVQDTSSLDVGGGRSENRAHRFRDQTTTRRTF